VRSSLRFPFPSELRAAGARALAAWAHKRQGEDSLPLQLRPRRVYILPTRSGVAAGVLLFVMLLAGLNYNTSLALLLCFMLGGVAIVSMYECHRMLVGLKVEAGHVEPSFAGRGGELTLQFANEDSRTRARLAVRCGPCAISRFTLAPAAVQVVRVCYPGLSRGRIRLPRLELSSDAPLGLFRVWCWLHLPLEALVYPAPAGQRPLPPMGGASRDGRQRSSQSGEEDWAWLRPFREGDPPRSVAWKAYARGAPLLVSHYEAPSGAHRLLDFEPLQDLSVEQRLSQLTQWVLDCEQRGASYRLALPGRKLPQRSGAAQRRSCLEALALYPP
jgi:uncharacterized protein (DUF58 family)